MDLENFKKLVICSIHIGELNDPILLKCQHAFCRSCIIKYVKDCERNSRLKECPTCNKMIMASIEELTNAQTSSLHKDLIETIHTQQQQEDCNIMISNEIKISLLGSSSCGKSSIMRCLAGLPFNERVNCTIGVDYITVNVKNGKQLTKVCLWDTAGQELYRAMIRYYYRNSKGIMLVYDVTNETSFNDIELWLEQIKQNCNNNDDELVILLIGNKIDLVDQRVVAHERASQLANRYNLLYYETSAKTGENVSDALERLVSKINSFIQFSQHHDYVSPNSIFLNSKAVKNYEKSNCSYC